MTDSFGARKTLAVRSANYQIYRLDAVKGAVDTLPYTLKILLENLLRFEDGENITAADITALANWDPTRRARPRDLVHAGARRAAGLHGRAGGRRPRRDARRRRQARRQGVDDQPAVAGRARHRSLGAGRPLRHRATRSPRTTPSSSSATRSATRSCAGARTRSRTSASCRRTRASCTR